MKRVKLLLILVFAFGAVFGQDDRTVITGQLVKVTPALKDMKAVDVSKMAKAFDETGKRIWPEGVARPNYEPPVQPVPEGYTDPMVQKEVAGEPQAGNARVDAGLINGFEGLATGVQPMDPSICVGTNHVIELVNALPTTQMRIYLKNGTPASNIVTLQALTGFPGFGDPIALYDQLADRYIVTEFIIRGRNGATQNGMSILVSRTGDPTQGWFVYRWNIAENLTLDYPKWAVGPNGLFLHTNNFLQTNGNFSNSFFVAFNKNEMYSGAATFRSIRITQNIGNAFATCPAQLQGTGIPAGGQIFVTENNSNTATLIECTANWTNNTFTQVNAGNISLGAFTETVCNASRQTCVQQPSGGSSVEVLNFRIMNQPIYRVFSGTRGIVFCFSVNAGSSTSGIRWVEVRNNGAGWQLFQQSTWHPNTNHQFMGSIAYDANGNIGLAYNTGSTSTFLSTRYTARKSCDPLGQMTLPETTLRAGNGVSAGSRWGDYNHLVADPDGQSLWMVAMYGSNTAPGGKGTFISRFDLESCGGPVCAAPTNLNVVGINTTLASVSWAPVSGASSYTVEFKLPSSSVWTPNSVTSATSTTILGLQPGTTYDWRVRTDCASGSSAFAQSQLTTAVVCLAPTSLSAGSITTSSAVLNWVPANGAVSYRVEFKAQADAAFTFAGNTSATSFALSGLLSGTVYDWRILTNCSIASSDYAQSQFTTASVAVCGAPAGLFSSSITSSSAIVSWGAVSGALSYTVEFKPSFSATWTPAGSTGATSISLGGLSASTVYDWRVLTNCSGASSGFSQSQFTTASVAVCGAPAGLFSSSITSSSAIVSWGAVSGALSYTVEFKPSFSATWTPAGSTGATSISLGGLSASTVYDWRVLTNCNGASSGFSQSQFTTAAGGGFCATPTGLSRIAGCGEAFLSWAAVAGALSYTVEYKLATATIWQVWEPATPFTSTTVFDNPGSYNWRVLANCSGGSSAFATSTFTIRNFNDPICLQRVQTGLVKDKASIPGAALKTGDIKVTPQPADQAMTVAYSAAKSGNANIALLNQYGAVVVNRAVSLQAGLNTLQMDVSKLPSGIYVLRLITGGAVKKQTVIVE